MGMDPITLGIGALFAAGGESDRRKGAEKAASAAQSAQLSKQAEARRQYDLGMGQANTATVSGLLSYDKAIAAQEKNLARQEQLIAQIDPTIIEASQQALKLLRGDSASSLAPLKQQREMQRQKLVNTLRAQLGPGAETSSAGMQALSNFDQQSASLYANAQQSALQTVGQTFGQFNQGGMGVNQGIGQGIGAMAGYGQAKSDLGFRQAEFGRLLGQPLIGSAGAEYTGDVMRGQAQQASGGSLMNLGGMLFGGGLGGKSGGLNFGNIFGGGSSGAPKTWEDYGMGKSDTLMKNAALDEQL